MFLERLIRHHCPGVATAHEPGGSRYLMMMGNLRNDTGLLSGMTRRLVRRHQAAFHDRPGGFVEINPFLCAVTDLLPDPGRPLRVVHMVRHPAEWSRSMTTFKASARYRHVIDFVPFAKPYPAPRPDGWHRLSAYEKGLYRWNWCNARIADLAGLAERYARVRAEDVFAADPARREGAVGTVFETLGLAQPERLDTALFAEKVNPRPAGAAPPDAAAAARISGALARSYGYEI